MVCCLDYLGQGLQTFSVQGQIINILGFVGHVVSVATTQLYQCSEKQHTQSIKE